MKPIAARAQIKESATLAMNARAKKIAAAGEGARVISLSVGEPDYPPPPQVAERTAAFIRERNGRLVYTAGHGTPELRRAIAAKVRERTGLAYDPEKEIIVTVGGKHGLAGAILALANPGDRVLIPSPYWLSYPPMAVFAGAEPVILDGLDTGFKLTVERLRAAAHPRNVALVLNSPANPTGVVYTREELMALCEEATRQDLWIISDEIYDRLLYEGAEFTSVPSLPGMRDRTLLVNGVSKTYSMTGWRIGYVCGPEAVVTAMKTLQSHMTSNPCAAAQHAALAALSLSEEELLAHLGPHLESLRRRRALALEHLRALPGLGVSAPAGAFYIVIDVRPFLGTPLGISGQPVRDDEELAFRLLDDEHVAVAALTPFGAPGFLRLSFAVPDEDLVEGIARLARFLRLA
ncbi:MAG TPA: pyridoxal phosphate-dependent aminotransferase [Thermoanaerobaculaceae bacterium]|nr:pyridoxal phosphate-dependent aminotransferase [Thermoanaerobaculaceae bacterium]HRS17812.1 pyridoxal phosphate-dependent aminotransferase [Thermoanaerobaculaceae bacterium]